MKGDQAARPGSDFFRSTAPEVTIEVWRENADAVDLFCAMGATQWRWNEGRRAGLDYAALPGVAWALERPGMDRKRAFLGLQVMEDAALRIFNSPGRRSSAAETPEKTHE